MSLRWDPTDDAAEDHGQHVEGSLDFYSEWAGPLGDQVFAAADRLSSLSSRLHVAPEGLTGRSSRPRGLPKCVVCDDAGCPHCPGVAA